MTASRLAVFSFLLVAAWFLGFVSSDDFLCKRCVLEQDQGLDSRPSSMGFGKGWDMQHLNCSSERLPWNKKEGGTRTAFSVSDVVCPNKICWIVFGFTSRSPHTSFMRNDSYISMGCVIEGEGILDKDRPIIAPVYAPLPAPEYTPLRNQFICRRNGQKTARLSSSVSCFCYTSKCTMMLTSWNKQFVGEKLQLSLQQEGMWVIVDEWGNKVDLSTNKVYGTPEELEKRQFFCGECPCLDDKGCEPIGRRSCPGDTYEYTIETACPSQHCYMMNTIEGWVLRGQYGSSRRAIDKERLYIYKGCASINEQEQQAVEKDPNYPPLFFAYPSPHWLPSINQWACRRNHNDTDAEGLIPDKTSRFYTSMTCFCYTSNCQTAFDPEWKKFWSNVGEALPPAGNYSWVIVDEYGNRTEHSNVPPKIPMDVEGVPYIPMAPPPPPSSTDDTTTDGTENGKIKAADDDSRSGAGFSSHYLAGMSTGVLLVTVLVVWNLS